MRRSLRDAVLTISGGSGKSVTVVIGTGDISWTESTSYNYGMDRGVISDVNYGDESPCEVSFGFIWSELIGATSGVTVYEALHPSAGGWNTATNLCEPPAIDLVLTLPSCYNGTTGSYGQEVITFAEFRPESIAPGLKDGQISVSGKIPAVKPVIAFTAATSGT